MQNLIMNSVWAPGPGGGPQFFSGEGAITYDNFSIKGYRTCSVCMQSGVARNIYDQPVPVASRCGSLCFGYCIRAVSAQSIKLVAEFFDASGVPIHAYKADITRNVTYRFGVHMGKFPIPEAADTVRLSIELAGQVTACTFCAPRASFC